MANAFYNVSGAPTTSSPGASSTIRAEFAAIAAGFDKLPTTLTANQLVVVNAGGTGLTTTAAPILGTPASGTLTNCTGLPISTGVSGLAAGIATFLATPTSVNLKAAVTDETGSGALVFATSPTLVTPVLGTPASGTLTNCTGLPISAGVSGLAAGAATFLATPTSANLLALLTDETGTGANVFATSPTLVTPLLGTPTSGVLTNCTGLPIASGVSGLAAGIATFLATPSSANLLAALTTKTGTGSSVFSASPTLTGTLTAASISAVDLSTSSTMQVGTNLTVTGLAAVHTIIGGWSGVANFEVLAGGGHAVSAYQNAGSANAFLARVDQTTSAFMDCKFGSTTVGTITTNGSVTAYNTSSDARLKKNIVDAPSAGAIIDSLQVRSWDWKANDTHELFGFVAQELYIYAPFAVRVGDDHPTTITTQWGRDDSKLVPLLVKEVQMLRARVALLEGH